MNDQISAGMLQDITPAWMPKRRLAHHLPPGALAVYAENGKNYGVPWAHGMVAYLVHKDLFTKAGITSVPTTWTDFLADVKALKTAAINPHLPGRKRQLDRHAHLVLPSPPAFADSAKFLLPRTARAAPLTIRASFRPVPDLKQLTSAAL